MAEARSALRFFYEQLPGLHVIAAGSLLEFALAELSSFGVGRVRSLFMHPFSFSEYLRATGFDALDDMLHAASPSTPMSDAAHKKCLEHLVRFITVGGMPEVVSAYVREGDLMACQQILDDLTLSFYDDFEKYKKRVPVTRLRETFGSIIAQTGHKFTYAHVSDAANTAQIKECVDLLVRAGLVHPVTHTAANGIPLAAEMNPKFRKFLIFDTGIMQRYLRLDLGGILLGETLEQINKGAIAELFAGLELVKSEAPTQQPQLFYWQRESRNSQAEVDYVIQAADGILPVEVKSGGKGAMQSLWLFLDRKKCKKGARCSLENFSSLPDIQIYPLYAASRLRDIR
jgi:predicted AAA+ superfamily ATPase